MENNSQLVPFSEGVSEVVVKKSRFIGKIFKVETEEEAMSHVAAIRKEHYDARHHVFAYVLEGGKVRSSDDGEPQGTAGKPILELLQREKMTKTLCVVTRYFGGTLLGTGGLVHAYSDAAKAALADAGKATERMTVFLRASFDYPLLQILQNRLSDTDCLWEEVTYGEKVEALFKLPQEEEPALRTLFTELSQGKGTLLEQEKKFVVWAKKD